MFTPLTACAFPEFHTTDIPTETSPETRDFSVQAGLRGQAVAEEARRRIAVTSAGRDAEWKHSAQGEDTLEGDASSRG
jgi:hypothetical protein